MYRIKYLLSLIIQKLLTIVNIYDTSELIDLTNQTLDLSTSFHTL